MLNTIAPPDQWPSTPLDEKGNFVNQEFPFVPNFSDVIKWQTGSKPQKAEKKADTWRVPIVRNSDFINSSKDMIVWLGHSTFFIRINGVTMITDPVFYKLPFMPRYSDCPVDPASILNLDYILLSHNHRDHCDKRSQELLMKTNPQATLLTGLKVDELISNWTKRKKIQAAGWYQQYGTDSAKIDIWYVPSRHWAKRGMFDNNTMLWGGFVIKAAGKTIYFMGDSGTGSHFKEIASYFPNPDICIMGIGAYSPEWFMGPSHITPENAVKAFNQMGGKTFIPMHYGTFDLADEPFGEPLRKINAFKPQINGALLTPAVGEIVPLG
jgi:L-ascorbate metabolism protein UlaG (beta-lactamase superfamily)